MTKLIQEELTRSAIGAFYAVYNELDHGHLEHIYTLALEHELRDRGHEVAREVGVIVYYKGEELGRQKLDMVVDGALVIEIKSTADLHKNAMRQLKSYLHATSLNVGLLFHFGPDPKFYRAIGSGAKRANSNA